MLTDTRQVPATGAHSPRIAFSRVDFPQPFGPRRATRLGPSMRQVSGSIVTYGSTRSSSTSTCLPSAIWLPGRVNITGFSSSTRSRA
ncbi:hypothetical protein D3C76_1522270 [compost metagenome]